MQTKKQRNARRSDALSKERIVEAAIAILDGEGEAGLTFRALASRLATGSGAIYWHVADKGELLAAAADAIIAGAMAGGADETEPDEAVRKLALGLFDAVDVHPWVSIQLFREPWRSSMLQIFEGFAARLDALGVPERAMFDCASALVSYTLGVAAQNAANARQHRPGTDRSAVLGAVADRLKGLDAAAYPFIRRIAAQFGDHDDREQFLAGIDLILAGIEAGRWDGRGGAR